MSSDRPSVSDKPPAAVSGAGALRRRVTIAGIALIALIIATDTYEGWQDYHRVIADNEHLEVALSRAVTEHTARMIQEVDIALSNFAESHRSGMAPAADLRLQQALAQVMRLPFIASASVLGADGEVLATASTAAAAPAAPTAPTAPAGERNLQDVGMFTLLKSTSGEALYIDRPRLTGRDDSQTLAVGKRINSSDGAFVGIFVARLSLNYLVRFYARVNVNSDTSILLAREDGVALVQYPPATQSGIEGFDPLLLSGMVNSPEQVTYAQISGRERIAVSQKVADYPVIVMVSRLRSDVLRPWVQEERSSAARTLSLALLAAILLAVMRSALTRQERVDQEKHRLEQELAAVQRVEALGFLAASVAHDFNNVLTAIIGYAELARETADSETSASGSNIERLLAATERARLLVRRVLTFDPRRSLSYSPTRIEPIIVEVSQQVHATLPASINMQLHGLDQSASIFGDATEIYQVAMNLCSNAVHAMPSGGSLLIRLEELEVRESQALALGQLRPGRWVCMSVSDTGVGLADEQIASIFEPFYTTRQPTHGTGIGLTVVRNIILRMNGALDVWSRLGAGTRMAVYWPSIATPLAPPLLPKLAGDGDGQTIMVVDDEKELVSLTEELLASLGYEPVGFSDARLAVEAVRHDPNRFDAILTDERMQPMRGLEFAKLIHAMEPDLPIIVMTGHRDAILDARAGEAGVAEVLDKPLRVQNLREALARQLRPGRLRPG